LSIPSNVPGSNGSPNRLKSDTSHITVSNNDDLLSDDEIYDGVLTAGSHPLLKADLARVCEQFGQQAID